MVARALFLLYQVHQFNTLAAAEVLGVMAALLE
jgi:DNA-directed RNA polymerase specialized sigma24 family protein